MTEEDFHTSEWTDRCMSTNKYVPHRTGGNQLCPHVHERTVHPEMGKCQKVMSSDFWHDTKAFDNNWISNFIRGHPNLSVTSLIDALALGSYKLCTVKKTVRRSISRTRRRNRPALMSHPISKSVFGTRKFQKYWVVLKKLLEFLILWLFFHNRLVFCSGV